MSETGAEIQELDKPSVTSESNSFLRKFGETATSGANVQINHDPSTQNEGLIQALAETASNVSVPVLDGEKV